MPHHGGKRAPLAFPQPSPRSSPVSAPWRSGAASTPPLLRQLRIEKALFADNAEANDQADPTEKAEHHEPTEPTENAEPTLPMEQNEPFDPMDRNESSDQRLHLLRLP